MNVCAFEDTVGGCCLAGAGHMFDLLRKKRGLEGFNDKQGYAYGGLLHVSSECTVCI